MVLSGNFLKTEIVKENKALRYRPVIRFMFFAITVFLLCCVVYSAIFYTSNLLLYDEELDINTQTRYDAARAKNQQLIRASTEYNLAEKNKAPALKIIDSIISAKPQEIGIRKMEFTSNSVLIEGVTSNINATNDFLSNLEIEGYPPLRLDRVMNDRQGLSFVIVSKRGG